jgi:hypothetical protein
MSELDDLHTVTLARQGAVEEAIHNSDPIPRLSRTTKGRAHYHDFQPVRSLAGSRLCASLPKRSDLN